MRPQGCEPDLLRAMASMPFLDRTEMVAVSGWSRAAVYEAVDRLDKGGFCAALPHATPLFPSSTQRYYLTAAGLRRLAGEEGTSLDELLRSRPVSAQWRRSLMGRLDSLAVVYALAVAVSAAAYPIGFRWYRATPLDAAVELPDGRTVGIVRQGLTADRTAFSNRMWRLRQGPLPGAVLVLMQDPVRLRHVRRSLDGFPVPIYLAVEREAAAATPDDPVWSPPKVSASIELRAVLDRIERESPLPEEAEPQRVSVAADVSFEGPGWKAPDYLPASLKPAEKRTLELVSDWPWISLTDLAGLMGVSLPRASQVVTPLEGLKLVTRPHDAGGRLVLTDRALTLLARRDRTSVSMAKSRWSAELLFPGTPCVWDNVTGARSRQLLRNLEHTAAVHSFLAALTMQAGLLEWDVAQIDPPRRASRHFRHGDGMRSVNPDAFGILGKGDATWPFFLEWERRAVRPSTMSERLAPYLRYYSSHRPTDDHGTRPSVLIVFDDEIAHTHFLRLAQEEMQARGVAVPLWVSHRTAIEQLGPLGRAWRAPGGWDPPQAMPPQ